MTTVKLLRLNTDTSVALIRLTQVDVPKKNSPIVGYVNKNVVTFILEHLSDLFHLYLTR